MKLFLQKNAKFSSAWGSAPAKIKSKSNQIFYYTAPPSNTAHFEETWHRWRAVGKTVFDLTGLRFEPRTFRSADERLTARPTGRCVSKIKNKLHRHKYKCAPI